MKSQNENSLSLNDQSELSVLMLGHKSQLQIKYEELFKQMSVSRSQLRQVKHQNEWLKNSMQGLQNECYTLKQLLRDKKQLLVQANSDIRSANEEINRLQDLLAQHQSRLQNNHKELQCAQIQGLKHKQMCQKYEHQIRLSERQKSKLSKQIKQIRVTKIEEYQNKIDSLTLRIQEMLEHVSIHCQPESSNKLGSFEDRIEQIIDMVKQKQVQKMESQKKIQEISHTNDKKIMQLEVQFKQASQIVQQYKIQHQNTSKYIQQLQNKISQQNKYESNLIKNIKNIIEIVKPILKKDSELLMKIVSLIHNKSKSKNQFEIGILLQQLKGNILRMISQEYKTQSNIRENSKLNSMITSLKEEYDCLKLKHLTLQRQYQAVMEDNRRILKFNNLSRYRMDRNTKTFDSNKQNKIQFSN